MDGGRIATVEAAMSRHSPYVIELGDSSRQRLEGLARKVTA